MKLIQFKRLKEKNSSRNGTSVLGGSAQKREKRRRELALASARARAWADALDAERHAIVNGRTASELAYLQDLVATAEAALYLPGEPYPESIFEPPRKTSGTTGT
jgi:hypothetical protein